MDNYNIYQDYDQILFKNEVARGTRQLNIRATPRPANPATPASAT